MNSAAPKIEMTPLNNNRNIAYFSMEIALNPAMPTYSGGLRYSGGRYPALRGRPGVSMARCHLIHHKGYFRQHLDAEGRQTESPDVWDPTQFLTDTGVAGGMPAERTDHRLEGMAIRRNRADWTQGPGVPAGFRPSSEQSLRPDADRFPLRRRPALPPANRRLSGVGRPGRFVGAGSPRCGSIPHERGPFVSPHPGLLEARLQGRQK